MSKVTLIKDDTGKLRGIDPAHERAYQKWRKQALELQVGDTLGFSYMLKDMLNPSCPDDDAADDKGSN